MAHYLVTGAAGFIASQVSQMLLAQGHSVLGVDNLNDAYDVRIKQYRLRTLQAHPNFTFTQMDIGEREAVETLSRAAPFDAVFNLAARAGVRTSVENPWVYVQTNLNGTLNLLEICRVTGTKKFILASTSSIYGANAPQPTPETYDSSHPLQPYAASKKAAETMAYAYHYLHGIDVTVCRYFTVYGPAGRPDMVMFRFARWIREGEPLHLNGDGEQSRGFTYVDDIARGTIAAAGLSGYHIINLGGHESITINRLIAILEEKIGKRAAVIRHPLHPADALANLADVTQARTLLNWQPQVNLEEGITAMVNWYERERAWASELDLNV